MRCSICHAFSSRVLETRSHKETNQIIRRRQCLKCRARFSTQEIPLTLQNFFVIKRNGKKEAFQREKIQKSIALACRKSSVSSNHMEAMTKKVIEWAEQNLPGKDLTTDLVAERILKELTKIDPVVYLRFVAYTESPQKKELMESIKGDVNNIDASTSTGVGIDVGASAGASSVTGTSGTSAVKDTKMDTDTEAQP